MSGHLQTISPFLNEAEAPAITLPTHFHIPTPGDHYSPATGSAIMTLVYQMARFHLVAGGETQIVVSRGTRHDYPIGQCLEVEPTRTVRGWRKAADLLCARVGLGRYFGEASYEPASRAIPNGFSGVIFVHNNPAPLRMLRRRHPRASLCLWLNNNLFRTYSRREVARVEAAVDRFICCSQYIASTIEKRLQRASPKAHIVHNGADTDVFTPRLDRRETGPPVILFVGRVQPIKGADLLIRAALILAEVGHQFLLRIVGNAGFSSTDPLTPYEAHLRTLAHPLGRKVEFVPFTNRNRIVDEFKGADIFCVPSNWDDPCPLTVAEGMASGLPMVVSRRGGIPEVGGDAVLYFDPPDVHSLAACLTALLNDPLSCRRLASKARARANTFSYASQYRKLTEALS